MGKRARNADGVSVTLDHPRGDLVAAFATLRGRQTLDPGAVPGPGVPGPIGLGIAADGTATVAWTARMPAPTDFERPEIRAATARPRERSRAAQVLATDARLNDLAVAPGGAALATWLRLAAPPAVPGVMAALRPAASKAFGPPELVTTVALREFDPQPPLPTAGIDPRTGTPLVLWATDHNAGTPPAHVPLSAVLQLSARAD